MSDEVMQDEGIETPTRLADRVAIDRKIAAGRDLSGADMSDMARRGLDVYKGLAETLNAALAEEVDWSPAWHGPMPLWQVLVANVNRLGLVEQQLRNDTHVRGVVQTLKERAAASMAQLLEGKDDLQISGGTPLET